MTIDNRTPEEILIKGKRASHGYDPNNPTNRKQRRIQASKQRRKR